MAVEVLGLRAAAVVEREQHLAAGLGERRPPVGQHRLLEGGPAAAHVVGGDEVLRGEHRADLVVDGAELGGVERDDRRVAEAEDVGHDVLLGLDQDRERGVAGVGVGPRLHLGEAGDEGPAGGLDVDLVDVEHLEARLVQLGDAGIGGQAGELVGLAVREDRAVRVGPDVELDLAGAEAR